MPYPPEPKVDMTDPNSIIAWLSWVDPNGDYTDEGCDAQGLGPLDLEAAQDLLVFVNRELSDEDKAALPFANDPLYVAAVKRDAIK